MQLLLRRWWIQITADRKRFWLFCVTLLIGLLLWGRIIVTSNMPRTAVANPPPSPGGSTPRHGSTAGPDKPPPSPPRPVRLARRPTRDPVLISERYFPKPTPVVLLGQENPKSGPDATENGEQAEAQLTEQLRRLVSGLRLEGVMQGRMAVVNGRTFRLHSWIPAGSPGEALFQLTEIGHRSVVLECEGRRFRLEMNYPGTE